MKEHFFKVFSIFFEALSLHCKPPNENAALRAAFFLFQYQMAVAEPEASVSPQYLAGY